MLVESLSSLMRRLLTIGQYRTGLDWTVLLHIKVKNVVLNVVMLSVAALSVVILSVVLGLALLKPLCILL